MLVTASKAAVSGGVWYAPAGTTLPNDATTTLGSAFKSLGYVSDAGVTRSISRENTVVNAWGGATVAVLNGKKTETFKYKCIEADNVDVLGMTFGEASGTLQSGITVKSTAAQGEANVYVIESILADDVHQRIVIPAGVITDIGDIVYVDNAVLGYDVTITSIADSNGVTAYEYLAASGATGASS